MPDHLNIIGAGAGEWTVCLTGSDVVGRSGNLKGKVRRIECDFEKKSATDVLVDERKGPLGDQVGHVASPIDTLRPFIKPWVARDFVVAVVVDVGGEKSKELVEAQRRGIESIVVAQMPLAEQGRPESSASHRAGQRRLRGGEPSASLAVIDRPLKPCALGIVAGQQGGSSR